MASRRILLMHDAEEVCQVVRACLSAAEDWQVLAVAPPDDALGLADREGPAAILLAAHLDVPAWVARFREQRSTASIPIVLLLAAPEQAEEERYRGLGTAGMFSVPLDPGTFPRQLALLLEKVRTDRQLARLERLGGGKFLREMIDLFLDEGPRRLTTARSSLEANDLANLERAVHSLKSSAGNLGLETVQDLAARLERLAHEQQADSIPALLASLEEAFARGRLYLEARRGAIP